MDEEEAYNDDVWNYFRLCGEPTLYQGLQFAKDLLITNLLFRFSLQIQRVPNIVRHTLSFVSGIYLLYLNTGLTFVSPILLASVAYVLMFVSSFITKKYRGRLTSLLIIVILLFCEYYIINPVMWQQIRGIQMIAAMKILSVAIDLDRDLYKHMLNPVEFGGYIFCPANCILGPWISFHNYNQYLQVKFLSRRWFKIIVLNLFLSMFCLILSNCFVPWYIDDNLPKLVVAYRDAQAFRMSHYFVSSMSIVSMVSAGFGLSNDCHSDIQVTKPYFIELPRSLVQVVIYWNIPMHQWLKNYVFKTCHPYGHFTSIFVTYVVSSLLHGLNFQLSAVLLTIGTFSYVEYNFRHKVAFALEVCCLANPCGKQCGHKHKKSSWQAIIINFLFSVLTVIHLAYLGVMFEASFGVQETGYSYYHTLEKWDNLNYFSHFLVAFMYLIYLMM